MTRAEVRDFLDANAGEFLQFDRIKEPLAPCPFLHALLLLDHLVPLSDRLLVAADHDQVYVDKKVTARLLKVAMPYDWINLHRCGCRLDAEWLIIHV